MIENIKKGIVEIRELLEERKRIVKYDLEVYAKYKSLTEKYEKYKFSFDEIEEPRRACILARACSDTLRKELQDKVVERVGDAKKLAVVSIPLEAKVKIEDFFGEERLCWGLTYSRAAVVPLNEANVMRILMNENWEILDLCLVRAGVYSYDFLTTFGGVYCISYIFEHRPLSISEVLDYLKKFFDFELPSLQEKEYLEKEIEKIKIEMEKIGKEKEEKEKEIREKIESHFLYKIWRNINHKEWEKYYYEYDPYDGLFRNPGFVDWVYFLDWMVENHPEEIEKMF